MSWEYKIVFIGADLTDEEQYEQRLHDSMHMLNTLGSEGWELIGFLPHQTASRLNKYHALFKRKKID
jgi:hypothetical protein